MTTPRIYVYKITFEEIRHYYYGVHKEKKFGEYYMGSPVTHKWMWKFYTPKIQILQFFEFSDEGYKEAREIEDRLIRPFYNTDPLCLNERCGGNYSLHICRKAGKIAGEKAKKDRRGFFAMSPEERREARKKGAETNKKNGTGLCGLTFEQRSKNSKKAVETNKKNKTSIFGMTPEQRREAGKKGGETNKKNGTGVCGMTPEQRREASKKGAQVNRENGTGLFGLTPEQRREASRKSGKITGLKHKENGTGIFSMTLEQRREASRKGGETNKKNGTGIFSVTLEQRTDIAKKVNAQKWQCTVTGYVTNAGALSSYQKARGIDTSNRIRLE
jgi:general stress protein YciG